MVIKMTDVYEKEAEALLVKVREKMEWVSEKNRNKIPYTTDENGDYDDRSDSGRKWNSDDGLNWWTNGFWGGIMWLLYQDTGGDKDLILSDGSSGHGMKWRTAIREDGRSLIPCSIFLCFTGHRKNAATPDSGRLP